MRVLLDTHFVIEVIDQNLTPDRDRDHGVIASVANQVLVSVASIWEAAIKSRLRKLPVKTPVDQWPALLSALGVPLLPIREMHVLSDIGPEPDTSDPFDRLLLGVCADLNIVLLTRDRALRRHPLAWHS
ncbi:MAG: type II toxin-antitoxin system VapC family toxin [Hyphomicrobiales bacterium]